jgi:AcrR family transcriptional regulator
MSSLEGGGGSSYGRSPDPLYERLPHGPHHLGHNQVVRNQRARLYGAMVETISASGYEGASVRQVVALAGVSRRSFYELFANKQECFLATFDLIATRSVGAVRRRYAESEGDLEDRLGDAFQAFAEGVQENWKAARLAIVEAQTVVPAGLERLLATAGIYEGMLFSSFALTPSAGPLPMPVVRGIVGGLHAAMSTCLREGHASELPALTEEMLRWTLLFQPTETSPARLIATRVLEPVPEDSASRHGADRVSVASRDDRERLLHHTLRLALIDDYQELSAPQIAEEAGVPIDRFFELFADKNACFLAALDTLGNELLELAADPGLLHGDWPRAVRRVTRELMLYLAERPLSAQTIAAGAFAAGPQAAQRMRDIGRGLVTLLVEGAPRPARSAIALEGIRGALGHTIRGQVASGEIHRLPAQSDYLAYVVLTPFIGANAAAEIVTEDQPRPGRG